MRLPPCRWIDRDAQGRPRCEHGWAVKAGPAWWCRAKKLEADRRYLRSAKGKEFRHRHNRLPSSISSKQLYDLTRVRMEV